MNSSEAGAPIRGTLLEQLLQLGGTTSKGSVVDAVRLSHALRPLDAMHSSRADPTKERQGDQGAASGRRVHTQYSVPRTYLYW